MIMKKIFICFAAISLAAAYSCQTSSKSEAEDSTVKKVYFGKPIGDYSDAHLHINECGGKTFLGFMKDKLYHRIKQEADNAQNTNWNTSHIKKIEYGHGVEMQLTGDVTTLHVAFPFSDIGGRSFGVVGSDRSDMDYVADASYSHYFRSLEKAYEEDRAGIRNFYEAILGVLYKCDPSKFDNMTTAYKRVAADFMAVYIAEMYRNLVKGDNGDNEPYLKQGRWDNAHLQTTLIAAFHSGQTSSIRGMVQEGKFKKYTYGTWDKNSDGECTYKNSKDGVSPRPMKLEDYTQANKDCSRSGVNKTRGDWERLTDQFGINYQNTPQTQAFQQAFNIEWGRNVIERGANYLTDNDNTSALGSQADAMIQAIVDYLMMLQADAIPMTQKLEEEFGEN